MRIIIEIDEKCPCKTSVEKTSDDSITETLTENVDGQTNAIPPPELLKIASELGAESAGAAPAEFIDSGGQDVVEEPVAHTDIDEEYEDIDAGTAPESV